MLRHSDEHSGESFEGFDDPERGRFDQASHAPARLMRTCVERHGGVIPEAWQPTH